MSNPRPAILKAIGVIDNSLGQYKDTLKRGEAMRLIDQTLMKWRDPVATCTVSSGGTTVIEAVGVAALPNPATEPLMEGSDLPATAPQKPYVGQVAYVETQKAEEPFPFECECEIVGFVPNPRLVSIQLKDGRLASMWKDVVGERFDPGRKFIARRDGGTDGVPIYRMI